MKKKIYNIILIILVILLLVVISIIISKHTKNKIKENELTNIVTQIKTQLNNQINEQQNSTNKIETTYKGYNIVGIIKIPKINIEYPIIEKTSNETMALSITKFWGNNVNDIGNFAMAGHNYFDSTMFSNTKKLTIGDIIEMTDLQGNSVEYAVFEKYTVNPNDTDCIKCVKENTREITLITCINGRSNRLIVKAREII